MSTSLLSIFNFETLIKEPIKPRGMQKTIVAKYNLIVKMLPFKI